MHEGSAQRAQRWLRAFGEELPETGSDDRPDDSRESAGDRDRWLRENRPPHHDGPM